MNSGKRIHAWNLAVLLAVLSVLASVAVGAPVTLSNGVPATGLSGGAGSEQFFVIEVPAGQDDLEISTSGGTGDVDLYVRRGSPPTTTSYDYRPYKVGNDETVSVENPTAGTWHIMLRGYTAYSGVTLLASYSAAITITPLANGIPVTGLATGTGTEQYFQIDVPAGQTKLEISISGGTGDADLYVKLGALPTTISYDYRPFLFGNNETVTVNNPTAGTWYIMIRAYNAYAGLTLLASYGGGVGTALENGVPVPNIAGAQGSQKIFRIDVPAGQTNLEIKMFGGTGDADLYVKLGAQPTLSDYDYRPFLAGNNETVTVNAPAAGTWYIMIHGYHAYSGVTLQATYGGVLTLQDAVPVPNLSGALGSEKFYKIEVPSGQSNLLIQTSGGTGNVDVYIRRGAQPTTATWDYRLNQPGNAESVNISNPQAGTWYIMLKGTQAYSGVTLEGDYSVAGTVTLLTNNVPVPSIAGSAGQELFYKIDVPAGQAKLEIKMSGGTGDADLYVRFGAVPTTSAYDYKPYLIGNNETVTVNNPTAGSWFIMIRGYTAFTGVTLVATYGGATPPPEVITLSNDVPVPGISGAAGSEKFYKIDVPAGQASLTIMISGGTGDVDLYVRMGAKPTTTEWDYRPYLIGNDETVAISNPTAGTYFIMLRGYTAYTGVTLKATYVPTSDPVTPLQNGVPQTGLFGAAGSEKHYKIDVPAGQEFLTIELSGGAGNADLYVRKGSKPTTSSWDYRPYLPGNNEKVEVTNPAAATWYIMIRGRDAYASVTLVAKYGIIPKGNDFTTDPHCVALWKFEVNGVRLDSIGSNNLENHGVTVETGDFKEGAGCADFRALQSDWMIIDNADLSGNFPSKSSDTNVQMSICFWMKPRAFPFRATMISKYLIATDARSWRLFLGTSGLNGNLELALGTSGGDDYDRYAFDAPAQQFPKNRWYHVAFTYRESDKSIHIRIWDDTAGVVLYDYTGTADSTMSVTDAPVVLGNIPLQSEYYDGLLDEVVIFDDILTTQQIDQIRQNDYRHNP